MEELKYNEKSIKYTGDTFKNLYETNKYIDENKKQVELYCREIFRHFHNMKHINLTIEEYTEQIYNKNIQLIEFWNNEIKNKLNMSFWNKYIRKLDTNINYEKNCIRILKWQNKNLQLLKKDLEKIQIIFNNVELGDYTEKEFKINLKDEALNRYKKLVEDVYNSKIIFDYFKI